ncbi:MAG: hypothetical protein R2705_04750 [Ilumatobacteraceae bacterium]
MTIKIVRYEQDREIAWTILGQLQPQIGHVYGYLLEPIEQGTMVTSYYDWSEIDPVWRERNIFPIIPEERCERRSASSLARWLQVCPARSWTAERQSLNESMRSPSQLRRLAWPTACTIR